MEELKETKKNTMKVALITTEMELKPDEIREKTGQTTKYEGFVERKKPLAEDLPVQSTVKSVKQPENPPNPSESTENNPILIESQTEITTKRHKTPPKPPPSINPKVIEEINAKPVISLHRTVSDEEKSDIQPIKLTEISEKPTETRPNFTEMAAIPLQTAPTPPPKRHKTPPKPPSISGILTPTEPAITKPPIVPIEESLIVKPQSEDRKVVISLIERPTTINEPCSSSESALIHSETPIGSISDNTGKRHKTPPKPPIIDPAVATEIRQIYGPEKPSVTVPRPELGPTPVPESVKTTINSSEVVSKLSERTINATPNRHKTPPKPPPVLDSSITLSKPTGKLTHNAVPTHTEPILEIISVKPETRKLPDTPKASVSATALITPKSPSNTHSSHPPPPPAPLLPISISTIPPAPALPPSASLPKAAIPPAPSLTALGTPPPAPALSLGGPPSSIPPAPQFSIPKLNAPPAPSLSLGLKPPGPTAPSLTFPKAGIPLVVQTAISKLKPVRLDPLPADKVKDTVWEKLDLPRLVLDDLEHFFGKHSAPVDQKSTAAPPAPTAISLFPDEKRARAYDLAYSRVKKLGLDVFERVLVTLDAAAVSDNLLETLQTVVPTLEERNSVIDCQESIEKLAPGSLLLAKICGIPRFAVRLTAIRLKRSAAEALADANNTCECMLVAVREIIDSQLLKGFLGSVLRIGNALNEGTARANASGLKVSCLPQVLGMKDNSGKETVLTYLTRVLLAQNAVLVGFPAELQTLKSASKLSFEQTNSEVLGLKLKIDQVTMEATRARTTNDDEFGVGVGGWMPGLSLEVGKTMEKVAHLREQTTFAAKYLGEDPDSASKLLPEELLRIVLELSEMVKSSVTSVTSRLKKRV